MASQNIISRRIEIGINQSELVDKVNSACVVSKINVVIAIHHISAWENNISQPSYRLVPPLAQGLDWDIDELLDTTGWCYEHNALKTIKRNNVLDYFKYSLNDVFISYIDRFVDILKALGLWFSLGFSSWVALYIISVFSGIQNFEGVKNPEAAPEIIQIFNHMETGIGIVTACGFLIQSVIDWWKAIRLNLSS